jgi:hypothetical protein
MGAGPEQLDGGLLLDLAIGSARQTADAALADRLHDAAGADHVPGQRFLYPPKHVHGLIQKIISNSLQRATGDPAA